MTHLSDNKRKPGKSHVSVRQPISIYGIIARNISLLLVLSLSLFMASCGAESDVKETVKVAAKPTYATMPVNTPIAVTLIDSIDTDVHVTGSTFRATLNGPIVMNGHTLFLNGALAKGILNNVVESGRLKTPAELSFSLTAIQNSNERWVEVGTNMITETRGSHTNREVAMIGGGAIVGGVIGKIINRKGSTEIGAVAGAVAGTGLSAATGKQDIFYGVGTEVTFYSNRIVQITLQ